MESATATKAQALRVANRFGMVLDEDNSGKIGETATVIFDHPSKSFDGDCRSITVSGHTTMGILWAEAIERMEGECPHLVLCSDPECDYHNDPLSPENDDG
jgi:succinate dehydrogenase/fumarate reductase flavoprotein subunit